jgi:hypothetical protein
MTIRIDATGAVVAPQLPLCREYLAVHFQSQTVQVGGRCAASCHDVHWAIGVSKDGQHEVLGVWSELPVGTGAWRLIHADLTARGVECIRFAVMSAPSLESVEHKGATVLNSVARGVAPEIALSPRLRQVAAQADEAAGQVRAALCRAIFRHGCFDSRESALSFLAQALRLLTRRLVATPPSRMLSAGRVAAGRAVGSATTAVPGMRATVA